jgi:molybdenum cofactor synthesis domain-containing protein
VPVEQTRADGNTVEILSAAAPRTFIRPRGEDLRAGELVMEPGKRLGAADLGTLASLNRSMIDVCRSPRVAIVATGDELVDVDQVPAGAQVVNSSAYALAGAAREAGGEPTILKVARDRPEEIRARLTEAFAFDAVLSTGGVSVGQFDHVKGALDELGMRQIFHGVAQRPGLDASDPHTLVAHFKTPYAAYKNLFSVGTDGIIKKDAVANCDDVSGDQERIARRHIRQMPMQIARENQTHALTPGTWRGTSTLTDTRTAQQVQWRQPRGPSTFEANSRSVARQHSCNR